MCIYQEVNSEFVRLAEWTAVDEPAVGEVLSAERLVLEGADNLPVLLIAVITVSSNFINKCNSDKCAVIALYFFRFFYVVIIFIMII